MHTHTHTHTHTHIPHTPKCTHTCTQDPTELESYIVPANYNLLTISDCNLCALLNLVNSNEEAQALIKQLSLVLGQNLGKAQTLEDAIAMNNTGLPFDKFEETRSKKQRSKVVVSKRETPVIPDGDLDSVACSSGTNMEDDGEGSSAAEANRTSSLEVLKVLSASPHIIFCYPKDGPMSYVLLGSSTAKGLSATTVPHKSGMLNGSTILEAERNDSSILVEASSSQGLRGVGDTAVKKNGREGGGGGVDCKVVFGTMRTPSSNGQPQKLPGILTQGLSLQNLIKPVDGDFSSSLMDRSSPICSKPSSAGVRAATSTSLSPDASSIKPARGSAEKKTSKYETDAEDNDLQRFSKFASSLVGIDPLDPQGFSGGDFVSNFMDGMNDGEVTNGDGGLDIGMDLSAKEDMPAVAEVPLSWPLHSNTDHTCGEEAVASQSAPLATNTSETHSTYVHVHSSDFSWIDKSDRRNTQENMMISNLPSLNTSCVATSTGTVLDCQTPVCNGVQNGETDVYEEDRAHTPIASTQEGRTMQEMRCGSSGMESMCESGDEALLGMSLDLDPDSLQRLLQLSFSPCKSAAQDSFSECTESDLAEGGEATFSLSSLIGKPTTNDIGSNGMSGEVAAFQDTPHPQDTTFSYSLDPSSCNPTSVSHTSTSFLPSKLPYPLSLSSPSPNVDTMAMGGANASNDDVWNSWQHCNADSIRMWLKSTSEAGGLNEYSIPLFWPISNSTS